MPLTSPKLGSYSLGRYQIASVLGAGAMGKVYKAFDPLIERTVAVKTIGLHFEGPEIDEFKARFYREAKAAGGLNHPNIVTIYDVAESDNIAYIAMELLEGLSLRQILDAESRPPLARAARIVAEVADALAYAHDRGVIHRDIKPANILLTRNGLTKITDFGIAQLPATEGIQPGLLVGSPRYMAPEQITGTSLDGRADIFSLGAVLYEMLTGIAPFQGQNLQELMYRILHQQPVRASKLVPAIPAALDAIVERALAKKPDERFQSARDLARALRSFEAVPKKVGSSNAKSAADTPAHAGATPERVSNAAPTVASAAKPTIASRPGRHRKSVAFISMGLAAGGVFASVAFNQFSPTPIEPSPSKMQS
ncbi:MAG: serine/threonine protein kinase, partial [Burkholderiales bacterium]|nr:serine/threonine protein kinase [Burkholderiales bacterium]